MKSTWDVVGRKLTHVNADGKTTSYTYDPAGLVTKKVEPGALTTSYTYDTAGRLATTTRPDTTVVTATYDAAGQLTKADYPGTADDVTYTYKADGARATMVDRTGTTTYTYGTTGLTTKVVNGATTTLSYGYDAASRLTSITYPGSKQVTYTYDNADQMTKVTDWGNRATTFTWTGDGALATQTSPNGVVDTRSYDLADQVTQIADKKGTTAVATFGYGYDAAGQLTSATINGSTRTYGYDQLGQLDTTSAGTYTATPAGLLTNLATGATQTYNTAQQLTTQTPTSGPATSYGYDANGSRTTSTLAANGSIPAQTTTYSYDASGDLATATTAGGTTIAYTGNGDGLRQTRTTGGTTTKLLWNTATALPLLLDDGTNTYIYGPSATPVEQITTTNGTVAYLHADNLGSVRAITDTTGAIVGTADYDAYGKRTTTGTSSPIGYTGNLTDPTTGLVHLRARDYDPTTGQFVQTDPLRDQTRQPYAYTQNNPLLSTDPTGLSSCTLSYEVCDQVINQKEFRARQAQLSADTASWRESFEVTGAGFSDGSLLGVPLFFNDHLTCYGGMPEYWAEYALGATVSLASIGAGGLGLRAVLQGLRAGSVARAAGAEDALNGVRLRAQLTGEEISAGHAWEKHVVENAEFSGVATRKEFASQIENVVANGQLRALSGGRTAYWKDGTVVIRNPASADGGTAFRPREGYNYFVNTLR